MEDLTEEMIAAIQYGSESRKWEFKPPITWSERFNKRKAEITRAVFALSNTRGGGYIVVGIKQPRGTPITFDRVGLRRSQFDSFGSHDNVARYINGKSYKRVEFQIHGGDVELGNEKRRFVVLNIPERKNHIPTICRTNYNPRERHCRLKLGAIYIRSTLEPIESKIVSEEEEWEELILRLLSHKEELLHEELRTICSSLIRKKLKPIKRLKPIGKSKSKYIDVLKRDKLT